MTLCTVPPERLSAQLFAHLGEGKPRLIPAGTELIAPGEEFHSFYYVLRGWSLRYRALADGRRQVYAIGLPGDFTLTETSLFGASSTDTVTAVTDLQVMMYPRERIVHLTKASAEVNRILICMLGHEYALAVEHLLTVGRRSAYERVLHLLLELWHRLRDLGLIDGNSFEMPLTQEVIGDVLGLSIIHVNRTLQRLRRDRVVEVVGSQPSRVTIVNPRAAARLAAFEPDYLRSPMIPALP